MQTRNECPIEFENTLFNSFWNEHIVSLLASRIPLPDEKERNLSYSFVAWLLCLKWSLIDVESWNVYFLHDFSYPMILQSCLFLFANILGFLQADYYLLNIITMNIKTMYVHSWFMVGEILLSQFVGSLKISGRMSGTDSFISSLSRA